MIIKCACGCGQELEDKDNQGRYRKYISGHNNRKYDNPNEHKKVWARNNRDKLNIARAKRKNKKRIRVISDISNGRCSKCGVLYDGTNGAIFIFHHRDPSEKEKSISKLLEYSDKLLIEEIGKCDMMCSNCHLILHNGEY